MAGDSADAFIADAGDVDAVGVDAGGVDAGDLITAYVAASEAAAE